MERIVFLDRGIFATGIALRPPNIPHEWIDHEATRPEETEARLVGATIAMSSKVPLRADLLARLPDLRMINVAGTGTDHVDLDWCDAHGIVVSNSQGYAVHAVPEHTIALVLALRRNLLAFRRDVEAGRWAEVDVFCLQSRPIRDLHGSRMGIVGRGSIGTSVGRLAAGLGMEVVYAARKGDARAEPPYVTFDELIETSDVISLHCPLRPETRGLIAMPELRRMKRGAILVNTGRGGLVDEGDLVAALREGLIAGAGFDVLTVEPPKAGNPLLAALDLPNLIVTPHIAWASREAMEAQTEQLVQNIEAFCAGRPVRVVAGVR